MTADQLYESVVGTLSSESEISESKMFGSPGLKVGGKVFAMLYKGALVVKVPRERVEALVSAGAGASFDPGHGRVMKEWVAVEPSSEPEWLTLAREARDFVAPRA